MEISRREFLNTSARLLLGTAAGALPGLSIHTARAAQSNPWIHKDGVLKIGLLWSLTGGLSVIEKPSTEVGLFWVDEVNKNGGIAGMKVVPVVVDAKSNMKTYAQGVQHLIDKEKVIAVFGGYTSASRRTIMPKVAMRDHLLYYPTCYGGRECWQNLICTGPVANQHSFDLMSFMKKKYGSRAFFVGSNYVWPRESNRHAQQWLEDEGGEVVGTDYMPLGRGNKGEFAPILVKIRKLQPDWIFSTVVGVSDLYFRQAYVKAGFSPDTMPTASLTTSEMEVKTMGFEYGEGHIMSAPYFQSVDNPTNHRFVESFLASKHGGSGVTHYNMEETYLSFLYFKKAVEKVVSEQGIAALNPRAIRDISSGLTLSAKESPEGAVRIDPDNFNSWLQPKIGRFDGKGQIEVLYQRKEPIRPLPFMLYPQRGDCRSDGLHLPDGRIITSSA